MDYQVIQYPIHKALICMSGNSGLTEEFIYSTINMPGIRYTVLSSSTDEESAMGEIPMCKINNKNLKVFEDKEGLLVARNGRAGTTRYLSPGHYTINDHAYILSINPECPYEIDLKWLAVQYRAEFLSYSSASANGTWNKTGFFKNVKIDIPQLSEQKRIVNTVDNANKFLVNVQKAKRNIEKLLDMQLSIEYQKIEEKNVPINRVLDCMSGNSGLTSELIYGMLQTKGKKYTVLSGATTEENLLGEIPLCNIEGKTIGVFDNKDGLLVVRKGKAGIIRYIPKGNYTINDDAYILSVNEKYKDKVDLKWLSICYKQAFMDYASSSDNGTWNKTGFFNNVSIDIPAFSEQKHIVSFYNEATKKLESLKCLEKRIQNLMRKDIIV